GEAKVRGGNVPDGRALDAVVRADGFASSLVHFTERKNLVGGDATIRMEQGEKIELRFRLSPGLQWPAKLIPEVYFASYEDVVSSMWQPANRAMYREKRYPLPDFNFLNM